MKKPHGLDFDQRLLGNGHATHAKGRSKFQGVFMHKGATGVPSKTGAKKIIGRSGK